MLLLKLLRHLLRRMANQFSLWHRTWSTHKLTQHDTGVNNRVSNKFWEGSMAKRHFSYSDLQGINGEYKPGSTLGNHHMIVKKKGSSEIIVIGIATDGQRTGQVTLKPGDTLGYDCGTVWRVPRPSEYRDPIRRVLAENKIGQKLLKFSDEEVNEKEDFRAKSKDGLWFLIKGYDERITRIVVRKGVDKKKIAEEINIALHRTEPTFVYMWNRLGNLCYTVHNTKTGYTKADFEELLSWALQEQELEKDDIENVRKINHNKLHNNEVISAWYSVCYFLSKERKEKIREEYKSLVKENKEIILHLPDPSYNIHPGSSEIDFSQKYNVNYYKREELFGKVLELIT